MLRLDLVTVSGWRYVVMSFLSIMKEVDNLVKKSGSYYFFALFCWHLWVSNTWWWLIPLDRLSAEPSWNPLKAVSSFLKTWSNNTLIIPAGKITRILQGIPGDGGSLVEGNPQRNLGCEWNENPRGNWGEISALILQGFSGDSLQNS